MASNRNRAEVQGARKALEQLKMETATELGIPNYDQLDKGDLPARLHGKIGGNMVRKLISYAEAAMANDGAVTSQIAQANDVNQGDVETVQGYSKTNGTNLQ